MYFIKGAEQGHLDSIFNLAQMYKDGHLVQKNLKRALDYFKLAADMGD